jgi:Zn-dependent alcohol dehydrogenase
MIPYLIGQHSQGKFPLERLITYYDFKDYEKAFEDVTSGKTVKAVLRWV